MTMEQQKCERCGRTRPVKYLQQAVYVRDDVTRWGLVITDRSQAYRCAARASCKQARKKSVPSVAV
jgi:hypothetical protein